jgi:hypothetical protein
MRLQVMKSFVMQSPSHRYAVPLRPKYLSQHPILIHPQTVLPHSHLQTKIRNHIKNRKNFSVFIFQCKFIDLFLYIFYQGRNSTRNTKPWAIDKILWFYIKCICI